MGANAPTGREIFWRLNSGGEVASAPPRARVRPVPKGKNTHFRGGFTGHFA